MRRRAEHEVGREGARRLVRLVLYAALAAVGALALLHAGAPMRSAGATDPGATILVDDSDTTSDAGGCGDVGNPCNTVQAGVDEAKPDNLVFLRPGTYREQVEIAKPLTLAGSGKGVSIIESPDTLPEKFTTSYDNYPIVYVHDADDVTIQDLSIDGRAKGNDNFRFMGIAYYEAGGVVLTVNVTAVRATPMSGVQHGVGIFAHAQDGTTRSVAVLDAEVDDYQKAGMALSGADLTATVTGNTVTGAGPVDYIEQHGIQLAFGAGGSITHNEVSGHDYTPGTMAATGILIFEAAGVKISENNVHDNMEGLFIESSEGIVADDNTVTATRDTGVFVSQTDGGTYSTNEVLDNSVGLWLADCSASTVAGNTISGNEHGIVIDGDSVGADISLNTISHNTGSTSGIHVQEFGGSSPSQIEVHFNDISNNGGEGGYGLFNGTTNEVDAAKNWWGACDGPSGEAPGSGDPITDRVLYGPWERQEECPRCPDFDGDGRVLVADILYVVHRYFTDDLTADVNGSGQVDVTDILLVVGEYWNLCKV